MAQQQDIRHDDLAEADRLYEQYAKPLERNHPGEYMVVSPQGEYLLGTTLYNLVDAAERRFGPGNFVFKVGETAAFTWRWIERDVMTHFAITLEHAAQITVER